MFNEKMTVKKVIGMAIGLFGFLLMIIHSSPGEITENSLGIFSLSEIALLIAAASSAIGWIMLRRSIKTQKDVILIEILGFGMLIGSIFCLGQSLMTEPWYPVPIYAYPETMGWFTFYLVLALICSNLLAYPLYTMLLRTYTATFMTFSAFLQPLCAAFYGWVFLGETVTVYFFVASAFVFSGLFIFYREDLRQGYVTQ